MNRDKNRDDMSRIEDYGGPADSESQDSSDLEDTSKMESGEFSGGTAGTSQGNSEGERFGDFDRTGTGVDLTEEMENTDARSGLVKGGEHGADDVAGPAQYGGDAGGLKRG